MSLSCYILCLIWFIVGFSCMWKHLQLLTTILLQNISGSSNWGDVMKNSSITNLENALLNKTLFAKLAWNTSRKWYCKVLPSHLIWTEMLLYYCTVSDGAVIGLSSGAVWVWGIGCWSRSCVRHRSCRWLVWLQWPLCGRPGSRLKGSV